MDKRLTLAQLQRVYGIDRPALRKLMLLVASRLATRSQYDQVGAIVVCKPSTPADLAREARALMEAVATEGASNEQPKPTE